MSKVPIRGPDEDRRQRIVAQLQPPTLRSDETLTHTAALMASVCDTESAFVSLMKREMQCIVAETGLGLASTSRQDSFCTYAIDENHIVVVEDATKDPRFAENPLVTGGPQIRFYVGIPLVVDDVAVGTLCVMDTTPGRLDAARRSELFGAVNAVESYLRTHHRYGPNSLEHSVVAKLTRARMSAIASRFDGQVSDASREHIYDIQRELRASVQFFDIEDSDVAYRLGFQDTDAEDTSSE